MCSVIDGQWTKSHAFRRRSSPSTSRMHSPGEHEEVLLVGLAVVQRARLPGLHDRDRVADLLERDGVALDHAGVGEVAAGDPGGVAHVDHEPALAWPPPAPPRTAPSAPPGPRPQRTPTNLSVASRVSSRMPRYANVTATLALFVALGGTATAAVTLPRDSVTAREIARRGRLVRDPARGRAQLGARGRDDRARRPRRSHTPGARGRAGSRWSSGTRRSRGTVRHQRGPLHRGRQRRRGTVPVDST